MAQTKDKISLLNRTKRPLLPLQLDDLLISRHKYPWLYLVEPHGIDPVPIEVGLRHQIVVRIHA